MMNNTKQKIDMADITNEALFALARDLRSALCDMAYSDECALDHNGACQAHNYLGEDECPHARAVKLMERADFILDPEDEYEDDLSNLSGASFISALNKAKTNGHYRGWTFSELSRCSSVLPMTVYDDKKEDLPITKHQGVVMVDMGKGKVLGITVATTNSDGTVYDEFVPA